MATVIRRAQYRCTNDCMQSGCPGHVAELCYQSTADHYSFALPDRQIAFERGELEVVLKLLRSLNRHDAVEVPAQLQPAGEAVAWQEQLADALDCFWNHAVESERDGVQPAAAVAVGLSAVANRLREYANPAPQQPAAKGENEDTTHVPCWALPAVESALSMLDLQGYWHSDLAAFRDWLKEKSV